MILILFGLGAAGSLVLGDLELSPTVAAIFAAAVLFRDMKTRRN